MLTIVTIVVEARLARDREYGPVIAHAYLTSRGRELAVSESSYQARISAGHSLKTRSSEVALVASTSSAIYNAEPLTFVARFPRISEADDATDISLCVQVFCEVSCPDEIHDEWGLHTCGWANVPLGVIGKGNNPVVAPLCDQGRSPIGARGRIIVTSDDDFRSCRCRSITDFRGRIFRNRDIEIYQEVIDQILATSAPQKLVSHKIAVAKQPLYVSCGGCIVRPACAYLLARDFPRNSEDYYVRALDIVMNRRFRGASDAERAKYIGEFIDGKFDGDESGAVLMDVAMMLSTSCTYLYDEILSASGKSLVTGEDFSRLLHVMYTDDCEGFCFHAIMALRDILEGTWTSPGVRALQRVRAKYIATIVLKAVERASAASSSGKSAHKFAAHNTCDLIPIEMFAHMVPSNYASAIPVAGRPVLQAFDHRRTIIVGEGTARIIEHSRDKSLDPALAPRSMRRRAVQIFAHYLNVGSPVCDSLSNFYRYTMMSIVHDTLGDRHWPLAYIKWVSTKPKVRWGVPNSDYVQGRNCIAEFVIPQGPTSAALAAMRALEKFEHPSIPLAPPGTTDMFVYAERMSAVREMVARVQDKGRKKPAGGGGTTMSEVYLPLWNLTNARLTELELRIGPDVVWVDVVFEHIADALANAVFIFFFND